MKNSLKESKQWHKNQPSSEASINEVEKVLEKTLPNDLKEFYQWSNGGEGQVGDNYLSIWKVNDIPQLNKDYSIQTYLSNEILAFGTDGGGIGYVLDYTKEANIYKVPLGDLDIKEMVFVATTFENFIEKAEAQDL